MKLFAKYMFPNNGTENDRRKNAEDGLAEGMSYVVEALRVSDWSSCVYLEDYFQKSFNAVNFEFYDEFGSKVNIYSDPRTRDLRLAEVHTADEIQSEHIIRNVSDIQAHILNENNITWFYLPGCRDIMVRGDDDQYAEAKCVLLRAKDMVSRYSVKDCSGTNSTYMYLTREAAYALRAAGCVVVCV